MATSDYKSGLIDDLTRTPENRNCEIAALKADVARLTGERDALERSKAENDERFQIERDGAKAECDALRRELEELRGAK